MAGVKFYNGADNGGWVDFENHPSLIKKWDGSQWKESQVTINKWVGNAWVQLFPRTEITQTKVFTGSGLKYTNTSFTATKTWQSGRAGGGTWEGRHYTGWTGIKASPINGEIKEVTIDYTRFGAGHWDDKELPIQFCQTTLTGAWGTGVVAHQSKVANTVITTDTGMNIVDERTGTSSGTVHITNPNSIKMLKDWLNTNRYLVIGTTQTGTDYIQLTAIQLNITYTIPVFLAFFPKDNTREKSNNLKDYTQLYIYEDEIDMSLEEIQARRKRLNIKNI